ncbi:MAG: adenylate/guanylate cyclase domain-containing protein [Acidobacteria bacterium]|nr:adenylate/guanylate cyclase domain-containing protein [Acidobacteriota bacterium]
MALPQTVVNYISQLVEQERSLAYLRIDDQGIISLLGGDWSIYGITEIEVGELAEDKLPFLSGLLPLSEEKIILPQLKLDTDVSADLHIFSFANKETWVILLSVAEQERNQQIIQQKINDLSLLRDKQARMLGMMLGSEADSSIQELKIFNQLDPQREVVILFIDLRGFTSYSKISSPEETFSLLNIYLRAIIDPIIDEAGLLDKIIGDGVMAIFGILPSTGIPQKMALRAVLRAINAVDELNNLRQSDNLLIFDFAVGIASGTISLGLLNGREQKFLGALGDGVKLAAQLEKQAQAREILIDETTFHKLAEMQELFSLQTLTIDNQSITAFSYLSSLYEDKRWLWQG